MSGQNQRDQLQCSFCGRSQKRVKGMNESTGGDVRICNECIELCNEIIEEVLTQGRT